MWFVAQGRLPNKSLLPGDRLWLIAVAHCAFNMKRKLCIFYEAVETQRNYGNT